MTWTLAKRQKCRDTSVKKKHAIREAGAKFSAWPHATACCQGQHQGGYQHDVAFAPSQLRARKSVLRRLHCSFRELRSLSTPQTSQQLEGSYVVLQVLLSGKNRTGLLKLDKSLAAFFFDTSHIHTAARFNCQHRTKLHD